MGSSHWQRYAADPVAFTEEVLGLRLWSRQAEVLRAFARRDRVAVRSGHKVGKTTLAAAAALWYWTLLPGARVILTAPTWRQIQEAVWYEVRRLYRGARVPLGGELHDTVSAGLRGPRGRQMFGFSARNADAFSGISGACVLYVIDEAAGVPDAIFEALEGASAGRAARLLLGNPTSQRGEFWRAFHRESGYERIRISSEETPNAVTGQPIIPGLATRQWVEERRAAWGETSAVYAVRVRGDFAAGADDAVVPSALVEAALGRAPSPPEGEPLTVGVDVARFGSDATAIAGVIGRVACPIASLRGAAGPAVADAVVRYVAAHRPAWQGAVTVAVDGVGVGASVVDALRARATSARLVVVDVQAGGRATAQDLYRDVRAELWFALRDWIADDASLPPDEELREDLASARYSFDALGRYVVVAKDAMRTLIGRSPDRADALALAVYARRLSAPSVTTPRARTREAPGLDAWAPRSIRGPR